MGHVTLFFIPTQSSLQWCSHHTHRGGARRFGGRIKGWGSILHSLGDIPSSSCGASHLCESSIDFGGYHRHPPPRRSTPCALPFCLTSSEHLPLLRSHWRLRVVGAVMRMFVVLLFDQWGYSPWHFHIPCIAKLPHKHTCCLIGSRRLINEPPVSIVGSTQFTTLLATVLHMCTCG